MRLRSKLAIKCAKATSSLIKKMNRGSGVTLPGYVARLIDPKILNEMAGQVREKIIVTMGTNGKTTTNAILCRALESEGKKVIINRTGANMLNGIISAFVLSTDKKGRLDADFACIEVDEIASVGVLPRLTPDCALLTNISRDQLDRFGEVDITYNKLMAAVTSVPKTTLIINCDDIRLPRTAGIPMSPTGSANRSLTIFPARRSGRVFSAGNAGKSWSMISSTTDSWASTTARTAEGSANSRTILRSISGFTTRCILLTWTGSTSIPRRAHHTISTIPCPRIRR